jgi:hypothetical protein
MSNEVMATEAVPVHVMNEILIKTQEQEPEHFVFSTVTVQAPSPLAAQGQGPQLLLAEDPLRKNAALIPIDAPIVVCHSSAQASSLANQAAGFPAPDGSYIPALLPLSLAGTAAVWVTAQVATRVTLIINRRGK